MAVSATVKKYNASISEHHILNTVIDLLRYEGYLVWRNNVGAVPYAKANGAQQWVRFGKPGFSDIFAVQPRTGKFVALEVKRPGMRKNTTAAQEDFINQVRAVGGIAAVVCSLEEAASILGIKMLF